MENKYSLSHAGQLTRNPRREPRVTARFPMRVLSKTDAISESPIGRDYVVGINRAKPERILRLLT